MCDHEDYGNFEEFGPEPPEFPEHLRYCYNCIHIDAGMEPFSGFPESINGDEYELRHCCCGDIVSRLVTNDTDASTCEHFEASDDAKEEAKDPHGYWQRKLSTGTYY